MFYCIGGNFQRMKFMKKLNNKILHLFVSNTIPLSITYTTSMVLPTFAIMFSYCRFCSKNSQKLVFIPQKLSPMWQRIETQEIINLRNNLKFPACKKLRILAYSWLKEAKSRLRRASVQQPIANHGMKGN